MAEVVTIARPYAEALDRLARQGNRYDAWSAMLSVAAQVAADPVMQRVLDDPNLSDTQVRDAFLSVLGDQLTAEGKQLLEVLLENGRLSLLPQIAEQFEALRAAQEGVVEATIDSAYPLIDAQLQDLVQHLEQRFGRKITAQVKVDPSLIGGVKITVGDLVMDSTVKGHLEQMAFTLKR